MGYLGLECLDILKVFCKDLNWFKERLSLSLSKVVGGGKRA